MDKQIYSISQAAKEVGESASVLRYWEQALEIRVNRDKKGYRCYTGYDIQLFLNIKELKKRGLKLDAIREFIPRIYQYGPGAPRSKTRLLEDSGQEWDADFEQAKEIQEFEEIQDIEEAQEIDVTEIPEVEEICEAVGGQETDEIQEAEGNQDMETPQISEEGEVPLRMNPKDDLRIAEFQNILEKLIAQGVKEKNQEELRVRKLDEKIRFHQQGMKQVAAAQEVKKKRRRGRRRKK
ncbi:MAG: MerR family transcriptional regulator [Lachnospiraceae bacterium]|nr:MerR family transcriptional regulator [Lachnospiraceae bacterium]